MSTGDLPMMLFAHAADWEIWLAAHQTSSPGVWLQLAKKHGPISSASYAEALDVALCYGWIDSQKRAYDEASWLQKFSRRGPKSIWSQINRDHVARLTESGRMQPSGMAAVASAKQDGRWDAAYAGQSSATIPDDLQAALAANPAASAFFATLNSANRYAIIFRVTTVKKPETRARNIQKFVAMLERGELIHQ
ncbi:MAG: YdeI/OmpD-associated family protein [Roseiflexaceae bacterium]|nr:YdeI/OmpD-associated family protein [Roseiflexaceae bacterium]